MHNNAIKHAETILQVGTRRESWSADGFLYELRETTLDFWCLFAREWGDVRFTMVAYGGTETGHIEMRIAA